MSHRGLRALAAAGVLLIACAGDPAPRIVAPDPPLPSASVVTRPLEVVPAAVPAVAVVGTPPTPNTSASVFAAPVDLSRLVLPPGNGLLVVVDPGHGGDEVGAAANGIVEKDSNLEMARRVERLLIDAGYRVLLTRIDSGRAIGNVDAPGLPQGFSAQRRDLQARIDLANAVGASLFISIHSNGLNDPSAGGIETYYNSQRPFSTENRRLAQAVQSSVVGEMGRAGYRVRDRGALDDSCLRAFQGQCFPLFVLGPPRVTTRDEVLRRGGDPPTLGFAPGQDAIASRATEMPGVLVELLFTSNPEDARLLADDTAREVMARGIVLGISTYLSGGGAR